MSEAKDNKAKDNDIAKRHEMLRLPPGKFVAITEGHSYLIQNRLGDGCQLLNFVRLVDDREGEGLFTQDVLAVLANRIAWQGKNNTSAFEHYRIEALEHIRAAIKCYEDFSVARYNTSMSLENLKGHTQDEFDH